MTQILNKSVFRERRRNLRQRSTAEEKILWDELRNSKLGVKFRRQYSVGGYILDFCCPRRRLGIEIDGGIHNQRERRKYDKLRDKLTSELGFEILRFKNRQIETQTEKVIKIILSKLKEIPSTYEGEGLG